MTPMQTGYGGGQISLKSGAPGCELFGRVSAAGMMIADTILESRVLLGTKAAEFVSSPWPSGLDIPAGPREPRMPWKSHAPRREPPDRRPALLVRWTGLRTPET
jgi:hypothetical protein